MGPALATSLYFDHGSRYVAFGRRERNSPRRKLVSQISELEQQRRVGKLTQSEFESRRARILMNEQHASEAEAEAEASRRGQTRRELPLGAACCDRLLFGTNPGRRREMHGLHDPLVPGGL